MRLPKFAGTAIGAAAVLIFVVAGHVAAGALIAAQQTRQLRELGDASLRRAEAAVRHGVETLDEIARSGAVACNEAALQSVRLHVYQHGSVKDIRVIGRDGAIRCSAYPDTLEFDKEWAGRDDMLPASAGNLRLFRVEQFSGTALGILRDVDPTTSLAAIVGFDGAVFDIMPGELRAASEVVLQLANGQPIAQSRSAGSTTAEPGSVTQTRSHLFPLLTQIRVGEKALEHWHREPYWPIVLASSLLGLAFGVLLGRMANRPPDPVAELDAAIAAKQFKPYLQPQFDLTTGRIVGCEALARWVREDGSVVPPAKFIPLAESSGRIDAITWQVFSGALASLRSLLDAHPHFKVSVNIVPDHLLDPGFGAKIAGLAAEAGVRPSQVVLEITERQQVEDLARAAAIIGELRNVGFRIALDDVGVGHSGLSSLQALGASIIKIDKFFVDAICRDQTAAAIVQMLVRLARELRMSVVAEGIEDVAQSRALAACGVDEGQGYLVSPPLPADRFLEFFERSNATGGVLGLRKVA